MKYFIISLFLFFTLEIFSQQYDSLAIDDHMSCLFEKIKKQFPDDNFELKASYNSDSLVTDVDIISIENYVNSFVYKNDTVYVNIVFENEDKLGYAFDSIGLFEMSFEIGKPIFNGVYDNRCYLNCYSYNLVINEKYQHGKLSSREIILNETLPTTADTISYHGQVQVLVNEPDVFEVLKLNHIGKVFIRGNHYSSLYDYLVERYNLSCFNFNPKSNE